MQVVTSLSLDPLIPITALALLAGGTAVLLAILWLRGLRGAGWRTAVAAVLIALLANPSLVREARDPIEDVAVVVVDRSPSQQIGERPARTEAALTRIRQQVAQWPEMRLREVEVSAGDGHAAARTELFAALADSWADIPPERRAGALLITDGQVHDVPGAPAIAARFTEPGSGPIHALITDRTDATDRRLEIVEAPSFGIVGNTVLATLRVTQQAGETGPVSLTIRRDGEVVGQHRAEIGVDRQIPLEIKHGGENVFELSVDALDGEVSEANNRSALVVNGVRDRLRVLLVSGQPHNGERTWRNLLKSDPSVDLVHFTILRPPDKQDGTPIDELSLIAFPVRELFEIKLADFDLIIFDRYTRRGVLPPIYFENIADYVTGGGALLEASGPDFAGTTSLWRTALRRVLPGAPTGQMLDQPFRPEVTDIGRRHPVTARLPGDRVDGETLWGRWFRQIEVERAAPGSRTVIAMTGANGNPLLLLDRVGEGRIAQFTSDQIWLWSRGYDGGGPQAELLRRTAHWLMGEPELEEDILRASVDGDRLTIERRSLEPDTSPVTVTLPSGPSIELETRLDANGWASADMPVEELGVYRIADQDRTAFAVAGSVNPPELRDLAATKALLAPVIDATGGGSLSVTSAADFTLRLVSDNRLAGGDRWLGLRRSGSYIVTGVTQTPLTPALSALALALLLLLGAWWREGRSPGPLRPGGIA